MSAGPQSLFPLRALKTATCAYVPFEVYEQIRKAVEGGS